MGEAGPMNAKVKSAEIAKALQGDVAVWDAFKGKVSSREILVLKGEPFGGAVPQNRPLQVPHNIVFEDCKFQGWPFVNHQFYASINFNLCTFHEEVTITLSFPSVHAIEFRETRFLNGVTIHHTDRPVAFFDCTFEGGLNLGGPIEKGIYIVGKETKFTGLLHADDCVFAKEISIEDFAVAPTKPSDFTLTGEIRFRKAKFFGEVYMRNLDISGIAHFQNAEFHQPTFFERTIFRKAPAFYDAKIYPETIFDPAENFDRQFPDVNSPSAEKRYQTLKELFAKQQALSETLGFARLEMKAHAAKSKWYSLHSIYGWVADFGLSWTHPLFWLIVVNVLFTAGYVFLSLKQMQDHTGSAILFSLSNIFPFVGSLKAIPTTPGAELFQATHSLLIALLSIIQSVLSAILLFLIALGIRNRLRMK